MVDVCFFPGRYAAFDSVYQTAPKHLEQYETGAGVQNLLIGGPVGPVGVIESLESTLTC